MKREIGSSFYSDTGALSTHWFHSGAALICSVCDFRAAETALGSSLQLVRNILGPASGYLLLFLMPSSSSAVTVCSLPNLRADGYRIIVSMSPYHQVASAFDHQEILQDWVLLPLSLSLCAALQRSASAHAGATGNRDGSKSTSCPLRRGWRGATSVYSSSSTSLVRPLPSCLRTALGGAAYSCADHLPRADLARGKPFHLPRIGSVHVDLSTALLLPLPADKVCRA